MSNTPASLQDLILSLGIVRDAVGNVFHRDGSEVGEDDWSAIDAFAPGFDGDIAGLAELGDEA